MAFEGLEQIKRYTINMRNWALLQLYEKNKSHGLDM
jgi:hypothetical protein